jgi:crossover junction endodeoxyribonuclease RuvC
MKVLGIDPGVATTGVAVVARTGGRLHALTYGAITTPAGLPLERRLLFLHEELRDMIVRHGPDALAIEKVFFNVNVRTAMSVGHAAGVALLAAGAGGIPVGDYTPTDVKLSVAGTGTADKRQVQEMVKAILHLENAPTPPDAADACALAICHLQRAGLVARTGTEETSSGKIAAAKLAAAIERSGG